MRAVFALLFVVAAVMVGSNANAEAPIECGPHAEYVECMSPCQPKCNQEMPERCTEQCVRGCRCIKGFLLSNNNDCVDYNSC